MKKTIGCDLETCTKALNDYLSKTVFERKPSPGPQLVCWEDGEVRLSFSIKVF